MNYPSSGLTIEIVGVPVSQGRPRLNRRGGAVYDPNSQDKKRVRAILMERTREWGDWRPPTYPEVSFVFYMPIPKSAPKRALEAYTSERLRHTNRPDVDNLIKFYLDCMKGNHLQDDSSVSIGYAIKLYSPLPRTLIEIQSKGAHLSQDFS